MNGSGHEALIRDLTAAAVHYCSTGALIPGGGTIILAAATDHARTTADIGSVRLCCPFPEPAAPGEAEEVGAGLLTALRFDPTIRSTAMVPCSPSILKVAERVLLEVAGYDRHRAPPGISSMDWGTAFCCREGVPDLIYDRSADPFRIVIFAERPMDVVDEIIMLSRRSTNIEL
jgi:predicted fused transcriptional regulator/phosphomethylpyrimidine kinase